MRSLLDIRLSRFALVLLTVVSAAATAVILLSGGDRTSAQQAALAALRNRPHAPQAIAAAPAPQGGGAAHPGGGSGGHPSGGSGGSGGGVAGGGGSSAPAPAPAPAPVTQTAAPAPAPVTTTAAPAPAPTTTTSASSTSTTPAGDENLPKVGHVFELTVSAPSLKAAFGSHAKIPYLHTLAGRGTLLTGYHSLGDGELADELALVSGQKPNPAIAKGCATYTDFPSGATPDKAGLVAGKGCVFPTAVLTLGDQVTASGESWHAYVADMGKQTCVHPNSDAVDDTVLPFSTPEYDTRHNPFIYFHSLLDLGDCSNDDVDLSHLPAALHSPHATPEFSYLAANACADADPTVLSAPTTTTTSTSTTSTTSTTPGVPVTTSTTTSVPGTTTPTTGTTTSGTTTTTSTTTTGTTPATPPAAPAGCPAADAKTAGLPAENAFLKQEIPHVLSSPAFRKDGVLVIAVAGSGTPHGHAVRTGALVISRWTKRGHRLSTASSPYALLRLTEDAFGFTRLGEAATAPALAASLLGGGS
jgi:hypothetical protein